MTDLTPDSVTLSWTVPEGEFDSFVVQYKDRDGQPRVVPVPTDQRGVTIPGLEPSRKYKFLLYGLQDGKRRSPVSVEAKTGESPPNPQHPAHLSSHCLVSFLLLVFPVFTSSVLFEKPHCLPWFKADENQKNRARS